MAGKGGGAWKVAYADFVTAMMAFFMVMWITAQNKEVKQAVAQYFSHPTLPWTTSSAAKSALPFKGGSGPLPGPGAGNSHAKRGAEAAVAAAPSPKHPPAAPLPKPTLSVLHDGQRRTVGAVAQFVEDSAELTEGGKAQLTQLAGALVGKRNKIEIRAHATRRPLPPASPFQDAWHLCYARSLAVMNYLESQGIEADRIRLSQAGPFEPLTIREQPELQAQNARVEVYALSELVEELVGTREERAKQFRSP